MVSEITLEHTAEQRARAFSFLPLMYGIGSIIGPVLGGMLSNPVQTYPGLFGRGGWLTDFLTEYPYFLPCFISASICGFGLVFGLFYLEETLATLKNDEQKPLLQSQKKYSTFSDDDDDDDQCVATSPTPTIPDTYQPPSLREALTPGVLAICLTFGLFAFQAVFYDGRLPIMTKTNSHGIKHMHLYRAVPHMDSQQTLERRA